MAIPDEDVARVRTTTDMLAVLGEHVGLKRVGTRWVGLCPFHTEKTPSFSVNPQLGFYRCFGCGSSGDVITFVRETEHLSFVEAVEKLAARVGIALQADDPDATARRHRRAQLADAMARAVAWYHERLLSTADAAPARAYLRADRGYDGEIVRRYRLGWAPAGWDVLARALRLPDHVLRDTGLGFVNRGGRQTDAFRARVLFPIFDHTGMAVAIGGRILPGEDGPKYKNSSETSLYRKSEVLYGLNWAKDEIVRSGQAVVCEGYTDVIALRESGVATAVATCGTAVTEDHIRRLKNFGAAKLVLGYDADSAGQGAAERFYAWEAKHQIDISVAALPSGTDPADVGRRDPSALVAAVSGARPFLSFRLERLWPTCDLRTPEGRARAAEAAMAIINEHPSQLVRDRYIMQVSGFTGAEPDVLRRNRAGGGRIRVTARPTNQRKDLRGDEVEALWLAIHHPELVADRLEAALFTDEVALSAFLALASSDSFAHAVERADADAAELLTRLAVEDHTGSDADHVLVTLAQQAGIRLRAKLFHIASIGYEEAMGVNEQLRTLQGLLAQLQGDGPRVDSSMALVAFVVRSAEEGV